MQFVRFERSYDQFHPKGIPKPDAANYAPVGEAMKSDFPEVSDNKVVLSFGERIIEADKIYYADSSTFTVFGYKLISGDAKTALASESSVDEPVDCLRHE